MVNSLFGAVRYGQAIYRATEPVRPPQAGPIGEDEPSVDAEHLAAVLAGGSGAVAFRFRYEQRNNAFGFVADLTAAVLRASIALDNDRAIIRTAEFALDPNELPADFDANHSNIAISALLEVDGVPIVFTLGLFRLDLADEVFSPVNDASWLAAGADLTILLQQARIHEPLTMPADQEILPAVRTLCDEEGLTHSFPDDPDDHVIPISKTWPSGTSKLAIANDLLEAINWFPVYSTKRGIQTSRPILNPADEAVAVTYSTGTEPRMIVPNFRRRKNIGRFPNRVTISIVDPLRALEYGTVEDADPGSPNSTINSPLSAAEEQKGLVIDRAMALRIADFRVRDAAASAIEGTLITDFDPRRTAHETYRLVIEQHEQSTIWRVRGWTLSMENGTTMQHTLGKVDPITTTVIP